MLVNTVDYQHFCIGITKKRGNLFGVYNKNDYICWHPNDLNNRIYRKY